MWCPTCKQKTTVAVGNDELICSKCNSEVVATVPKPKSRIRKKKTVALASTKSQMGSTSSNSPTHSNSERNSERKSQPKRKRASTPEQTIASASAVVTAWTKANKKWRVDHAHVMDAEVNEKRVESEQPAEKMLPFDSGQLAKLHGYHLILFGLLIFLLGHTLSIWAFLAGHFGAWTIGNFLSVGGVTISIVSVVQALRNLEQRVSGNTQVQNVNRSRRDSTN